jgi:DNA (cytosine-5)-methyltransferase 1
MNYYNEHDPKASAWLRELIRAGEIPPGDVDERDIQNVKPNELDGYTQCHFFAGIGGWAEALALAGWPTDKPVWTGSCPCQPLSCAGQGKGHADERHLWPAFYSLIAERKPATIFGEQVASPLGREWFAGIRADMEAMGYAVGGADLCAASVGAPHPRQRLYWVADAKHTQRRPFNVHQKNERNGQNSGWTKAHRQLGACGEVRGMGNTDSERRNGERLYVWGGRSQQAGTETAWSSEDKWTFGESAWSRFSITPCLDGTLRRFEPGSFPLADGLPGRVGLLRGYGNAIVPQVASEFIGAWLDTAN